MSLQEINEAKCEQLSQVDIGKAAILFSTPLCGTCKVAERMLEVVQATNVSYPIYKININFAPRFREQWQISSIPCLVVLQNGKVESQTYAMQSVDHIYKLLR